MENTDNTKQTVFHLFLSDPNWQKDVLNDDGFGKLWISILNQLGSVIWSLVTSGGRSEARLWICKTVSGFSTLNSLQQRDLFVKLLRRKGKEMGLASQLWQMIFEKRPRKAGGVLARRSRVLEKFFEGNPSRILQWFSGFAEGSGLAHRKGAKALSQFAFVNRDICWEELEWKGKHGQSPAVVATKPHYLLDLDVQRTVENFLEYVPEFWSSNEFSDSLKDGDILFVDTKFFIEFFVGLMYKEDSKDAWEVINEFLMEEPFSSLCHHLLITLNEQELCTALEFLGQCLKPRMQLNDSVNSSYWLEFLLSKYRSCESLDHLLLLNAVIDQGRQLLRLVHDEEFQEEKAKIKDLVSEICTISRSANSLVPLLNECFKMKSTEAIKFLVLQSWVLHYALSEQSWTPESWELLLSQNGISFRKSDKYKLLDHDEFSEENDSELDDRALSKRKHGKKRKNRKKRRRKFDDNDNDHNELLGFDTPNSRLGLQDRPGSWLLSTDEFSASWTNADLPEHLSKFSFSTWMKWIFTKWNDTA